MYYTLYNNLYKVEFENEKEKNHSNILFASIVCIMINGSCVYELVSEKQYLSVF